VSRVYNNNFWVASESIEGGNTIAFSYDNDGLLTNAGALGLTRTATNGLITGTALGSAADARAYDPFGELTGYTAFFNGAALYAETLTRDADGRESAKTEIWRQPVFNRASMPGTPILPTPPPPSFKVTTNTFAYTYDAAGRLTRVTENGKSVSGYSYDTNSNRLRATTASATVSGFYDAQDRLLAYGSASYSYTADGELASRKAGTQTTTYNYDVLGNLVALTLPAGAKITYIVDAANRRVGKEVNGVLEQGFLYDGPRIVAQLNGSNAVVSQFVYATGGTAPDYMLQGGATYRIFSDQLGSPLLVVNASTGAVAEQIDYDEFGNVISDTNPGFQPFGFAGGLYDQDTKLVRFGARDYDPSTGRWTAKDPILFNGGDANLYGYVLNDPVNLRDPSGTQDTPDAGTPSPDAGTPSPYAGTPSEGTSKTDDDVWETWEAIKGFLGFKKKCEKGIAAAQAVRNGTRATLGFVQEEALEPAKSNIAPGAMEENKQLNENAEASIPAVQNLADEAVSAGLWRTVTKALGICSDCDAKPMAHPPIQIWQNQNP
jgi:RHS repeat-associated protein